MISKQINPSYITTDGTLRLAMHERKRAVGRASKFIADTYGEEVLEDMRKIEDITCGRPTIVSARQIAKPDFQHLSMYLTSKWLGYQMCTLEILDDFIYTGRGSYKRSYVQLPLGIINRESELFSHSITIAGDKDIVSLSAKNEHKLKNIFVTSKAMDSFAKQANRAGYSEFGQTMPMAGCTLPDFFTHLRRSMDVNDQIVFDISKMLSKAAKNVILNNKTVPGTNSIKLEAENGAISIKSVGGL